jgi:hypothetical protein
MTRKHFEAAALLASGLPTHAQRLLVADVFVKLFAQFNPRFDPDRFYAKVGKLAGEREAQEAETCPRSGIRCLSRKACAKGCAALPPPTVRL